MPEYPIVIKVPNPPNMTVDPTLAYVPLYVPPPGDPVKVRFQLENGTSLTISFPGPGQGPFSANSLQSGPETFILADVRQGAQGVYHYTVSAMVNGTIYTIPGCPEIVIE